MKKKVNGKVFLVGSGTGNRTQAIAKAKACLKKADWVLYDHVVNSQLLDYCSKKTKFKFIGKKNGQLTLTQKQINQFLVSKALDGSKLVCLKGSGPFVLKSRKGEAAALSKAGISFKMIPALALGSELAGKAKDAAAQSKDAARSRDKEALKSLAKAKSAASAPVKFKETIAYLRKEDHLPQMVHHLLSQGFSEHGPITLVHSSTKAVPKTITGNLTNIVELAKAQMIKTPAILIAGETEKLKDKLSWFENKPLYGKTIIVNRTREQGSDLVNLLMQEGACVLENPLIKIAPPQSFNSLDAAIKELHRYHWIVFTSANGVRYFMSRLRASRKDVHDLKKIKVAAVGPITRDCLESKGVQVHVMAKEYSAEEVEPVLGRLKEKRILIPRAHVARDILPLTLKKSGAIVDVVETYQSICDEKDCKHIKDSLREKKVHLVAFTNSATVDQFMKIFKPNELKSLLGNVVIAAIGPITVQSLFNYGLRCSVTAKEYTVSALTRHIIDYFQKAAAPKPKRKSR